MTAVEPRQARSAKEQDLTTDSDAETLEHALEAVLGTAGTEITCSLVRVDALTEEVWEYGASIRLFSGEHDVQDVAVFAGGRSASRMVRWLFEYGDDELVTGERLKDGLAEALNHVAGRIKTHLILLHGVAPALDTPERLELGASRLYASVHPTSTAYRVTSDAWAGEVVFMMSAKHPQILGALEQTRALLGRFGPEPSAASWACRLLEEVRAPMRALSESPALRMTLAWCIENLAVLVDGLSGVRGNNVFYCVLRELESLHRTVGLFIAPPETKAFTVGVDDEQHVLLREFCGETRRGLQRTAEALAGASGQASCARLFRQMHALQGSAAFLHLEQVQTLARATGAVIGSQRWPGATMAEEQLDAVRHTVLLVEARIEALEVALEEGGAVEWNPEAEAHTRMLEHVVECGGPIAIRSGRSVAPVRLRGRRLKLEESHLRRLEAVRDELGEWAELVKTAGDPRALSGPADVLGRAHRELVSICQSVSRVPFGSVLSRLARHCREASASHAKLVRVETSGESIHAPEHLVSAMLGPLVHLVDNAIAHGIEDAGEREKQGKKVLALIEIGVERVRCGLEITVSDDGRGISPRAIQRRADAMGVGFVRAGDRLEPDSELQTRGAGMDVVLREVSAAGGTVEMESVLGEGTRIRIALPEPGDESSDASEQGPDPEDCTEFEVSGELNFL